MHARLLNYFLFFFLEPPCIYLKIMWNIWDLWAVLSRGHQAEPLGNDATWMTTVAVWKFKNSDSPLFPPDAQRLFLPHFIWNPFCVFPLCLWVLCQHAARYKWLSLKYLCSELRDEIRSDFSSLYTLFLVLLEGWSKGLSEQIGSIPEPDNAFDYEAPRSRQVLETSLNSNKAGLRCADWFDLVFVCIHLMEGFFPPVEH